MLEDIINAVPRPVRRRRNSVLEIPSFFSYRVWYIFNYLRNRFMKPEIIIPGINFTENCFLVFAGFDFLPGQLSYSRFINFHSIPTCYAWCYSIKTGFPDGYLTEYLKLNIFFSLGFIFMSQMSLPVVSFIFAPVVSERSTLMSSFIEIGY